MTRMQETVTVDARGRLIVPRAWRESLGLGPGETALLESDGTSLRVVNARRDRAALVAALRGSVKSGDSVDDLIAGRRTEAVREAAAE